MGILAEAAYKCNCPLLSKLIRLPVLKYGLNQRRLRNKRGPEDQVRHAGRLLDEASKLAGGLAKCVNQPIPLHLNLSHHARKLLRPVAVPISAA